MNGKQAKKLRREIYGDLSSRPAVLFVLVRKRKVVNTDAYEVDNSDKRNKLLTKGPRRKYQQAKKTGPTAQGVAFQPARKPRCLLCWRRLKANHECPKLGKDQD